MGDPAQRSVDVGNAMIGRRWRYGVGDFLIALAAVLIALVILDLGLSREWMLRIAGALILLYFLLHIILNRRLSIISRGVQSHATTDSIKTSEEIQSALDELRERLERISRSTERTAEQVARINRRVVEILGSNNDTNSEGPISEEVLYRFDRRLSDHEEALGNIQRTIAGRRNIGRPLREVVDNVNSLMKKQSRTLLEIKEALSRRA